MEKSTKRKLIIGGSLLVVLGVGGYFLYDYLKKQKAEKDAKKLQEENPVIGGGTGGGTGGGSTGGGSTGGGSGYTFPFKTTTEGNAFRAWVNDNYPAYALSIQLDRTGSLNSYVQKAWVKYGAEYQKKTGVGSNVETPVATPIKVGNKVIAKVKTKAYYIDGTNLKAYNYGGSDGDGNIGAGYTAGVVKSVGGASVVVYNSRYPMGSLRNEGTYYLAKGDLQKTV
jgi:hypothetical protein